MAHLYLSNGHMIEFLNQDTPPLLKIVIISANSANPDEMLHSAASQLGLYCLSTYYPGVTVTKENNCRVIRMKIYE